MSKPTDIERATKPCGKTFEEELNYTYLGDWQEREGNSNIEEEYQQITLNAKVIQMSTLAKLFLNCSKWQRTLVIAYTPPTKTFTANCSNGVKVKVLAKITILLSSLTGKIQKTMTFT